jgi:hypothetical protein
MTSSWGQVTSRARGRLARPRVEGDAVIVAIGLRVVAGLPPLGRRQTDGPGGILVPRRRASAPRSAATRRGSGERAMPGDRAARATAEDLDADPVPVPTQATLPTRDVRAVRRRLIGLLGYPSASSKLGQRSGFAMPLIS